MINVIYCTLLHLFCDCRLFHPFWTRFVFSLGVYHRTLSPDRDLALYRCPEGSLTLPSHHSCTGHWEHQEKSQWAGQYLGHLSSPLYTNKRECEAWVVHYIKTIVREIYWLHPSAEVDLSRAIFFVPVWPCFTYSNSSVNGYQQENLSLRDWKTLTPLCFRNVLHELVLVTEMEKMWFNTHVDGTVCIIMQFCTIEMLLR